MSTNNLDRRAVLRGAGVAAAGVGLAACGGTSNAATSTTSVATTPTPEANAIGSMSAAETPAETSAATDAGSALHTLGPAGDVKVGSGVIYQADKIVVTQPAAGQYKAFTAVCTHQGCIVSAIQDGKILCNCHGSQFSIADGSVLQGPAGAPLAEEKVQVAGDVVKLGG